MIKLYKSTEVPTTLRSAPTPTSVDDVSSEIYGADDVRTQLMCDQYDKCAYCETNVTKRYNDVEHFRPKKTYYWLGHNWRNLLYSCDLCNRTYKNDKFPLSDELQRDLANKDISRENPLIINPYEENPLDHICFREYILVPRVTNGIEDIKGKTTIALFHLNDRNERRELIEERSRVFEEYKETCLQQEKLSSIVNNIVHLQPLPESLQTDFNNLVNSLANSVAKYTSPEYPHAGMIRGQI